LRGGQVKGTLSGMNYKKIYYALFLGVGIIFSPVISFASEYDVRSQCFATLKENMSEAKIFSKPLEELQKLTYETLEPKFSENYKQLSSFGLELDKGIIEMRVYSFGRQTGYIHPPDLPLPSSTKSDKWESATKEFIVAEEYVTDQEDKKHFLNCVFFSIGSENLLDVKNERYLYDGEMTSLAKVAKDGSYKAWYSENISFDYNDKPFVEWKRLFVYPKLTQNDYFNRYDIAEVFPANSVESFEVLEFFLLQTMKIQDIDASGLTKTKYLTQDKDGKMVEIEAPKEFSPFVASAQSEFEAYFPLANYYQAIENMFPKFAERLFVRGTLKYDTFKKLFLIKEDNKEAKDLFFGLNDYRSLAAYYSDKNNKEKEGMKVSDPEKDALLVTLSDAESVAQKLLTKNWLNSIGTKVAVVAVLTIALLIGVFLILRKNKKNESLFTNRNKFLSLFLFALIGGFLQFGVTEYANAIGRCANGVNNLQLAGYVCTWDATNLPDLRAACAYSCVKTTITYSGTVLSPLSVEGASTATYQYAYVTGGYNSPFVYFKNLPKNGAVITVDSKLNKYLSEPLFNQKNGWIVKQNGDSISVSGKKEENLFYELVIDQISLNRNGRNFSSKEEVISYLDNSDFFEKLDFSEVEKKNSLDYFIPKIQSAQNTKYYYLTILSDSAIEEISNLSIKPKPKNLVRRYFALYPTDVPVKAEGDIMFPKNMNGKDGEFFVKETGEILVYPEMLVFWDKIK